MDEDTTTAPDVQAETGADEAQPVEQNTEAADVQPSTEPSEPQQDGEGEQPPAPDVDDKLQKYAQSQGLELDSPSAIKAAQIAMKAQSEASRNYRKASELEKTIQPVSDEIAEANAQATGQDPELLKRLQRVEVRDQVREFWDSNPDARQYESKMVELVSQKPHLAGDLEALYATAVMQSGKLDTVRSQGKREALQSLAHKQQAAVPTGHATNPGVTPKTKDFGELSIKEMEAKLGFVRR